jgi:hypothetical protein
MWLGAIDTFVTGTAGLLVLVVPLPLEAALLGWLAAAECALFAAGLPLAYEFAFMEWNKMPFTCSYLPGKTTGVILLTAFLGIFAVVPVLSCYPRQYCLSPDRVGHRAGPSAGRMDVDAPHAWDRAR